MSEQNIYDNQTFFDGYKKLRENPSAANIIVEKPALFSLLPNLKGKSIMDLGCGYGENCKEFSRLGAIKVLGIDISEKMLQVANQENKCANVNFMKISMNDLSAINKKYDVVVSSLAVHYIENLDRLLSSVYDLLTDDGYFIFSQEHPLTTALLKENYWSRDSEGNILHYNLTDYSLLGERKTKWIVEDVIKYHRTFSSIFNSLIKAGFTIEKVLEPLPDEKTLEQYPSYKKYYHKPDYLLIKAKRLKS